MKVTIKIEGDRADGKTTAIETMIESLKLGLFIVDGVNQQVLIRESSNVEIAKFNARLRS